MHGSVLMPRRSLLAPRPRLQRTFEAAQQAPVHPTNPSLVPLDVLPGGWVLAHPFSPALSLRNAPPFGGEIALLCSASQRSQCPALNIFLITVLASY